MKSIKAGLHVEAKILHGGVASFLGLVNMVYDYDDTRYNQWVKHKMAELSCCLRSEAIFCNKAQRDLIVNTLALFTKLFEILQNTGLGEKTELPEPFDENMASW